METEQQLAEEHICTSAGNYSQKVVDPVVGTGEQPAVGWVYLR